MEESDKILVYYKVRFVEYDRLYNEQFNTLEEAEASAVAFRLHELCDATVYKITREKVS